MLRFANKFRINKDEYLSKHTGALQDGTIVLLAHAVAHVEHPSYSLIAYILIDGNTCYESSLFPKLARLNEIFVYTDIIATVLVGNTQHKLLCWVIFQYNASWVSSLI